MTILFRVDASTQIGTGHVMRCLTLAKMLRTTGLECEFFCRLHAGNLVSLIESHGFIVHALLEPNVMLSRIASTDTNQHSDWLGVMQQSDAIDVISLIGTRRIDWVIVDHYGIDSVWEFLIRPYCKRILVIDDLANRSHDCDVLLDQNLAENYLTRYDNLLPDYCVRLLGPRYALLHADFENITLESYTDVNAPKRVLVFFGGTDVGGITAYVVNVLMEIDDLEFHLEVVLNNQSASYDTIKANWSDSTRLTFHSGLPSLASLMARCDAAIGAGGVTTWERICMALPSMTITVADNQVAIAEYLQSQGLVSYCGKFGEIQRDDIVSSFRTLLQQDTTPEYIYKCRSLVSGNGAKSVATCVVGPLFSEIRVRKALPTDLILLFEWANDPHVRKNSLNSGPISFDEHQNWFHEKITSPTTKIYIAESETGVSVGVVRFEDKSGSWVLNYNVAPLFRGKGLSRGMLSAALRFHRNEVGCCKIIATVKIDNVASRIVLEKESFALVKSTSDVLEYEFAVK